MAAGACSDVLLGGAVRGVGTALWTAGWRYDMTERGGGGGRGWASVKVEGMG